MATTYKSSIFLCLPGDLKGARCVEESGSRGRGEEVTRSCELLKIIERVSKAFGDSFGVGKKFPVDLFKS